MKAKSIVALAAATLAMSANATIHYEQLDLGDFNNPTNQIAGQNLEQAPFNLYYTHSGSQVVYNADETADLFEHDCEITSLTFIYGDPDWTCYEEISFEVGCYLQLIDADQFTYENNTTYWFKPEKQSVIARGTLDYTYDLLGQNFPVTLTFDIPFEIKAADKGKSLLLTSYSNVIGIDADPSASQYLRPYVYNNDLRNYRMACYGYDLHDDDFLETVEAGAKIKNTDGTHSDAYRYDLPIVRIEYNWDDTPVEEPKEGEDDPGVSSISEITADSDAAEYFNLQGIRIDRPAAGQIVIRRTGNTTTKLVIR